MKLDSSTSSLCVEWKKLLAAVDVLGYFFWICNPDVGACTPPSSWFEIIHCWPPLWSPPRQHGPAWMQIYSRIGIWGDWNIWFFTQPIIVLFFQQTFPPLPIEFSWTLVAPHSLKNSSMLVRLLSVLFSWVSSSTLQPFSALQCKRSRMEDGWLNGSIGRFLFGLKHCLQFSLDFVSPPFGRFDANLYAAGRLSHHQ